MNNMGQLKIFLINEMPLLMQGLKSTLQLWIIASLFSLVIGILLGIFRSNVLRIPYISTLLDNITFIFRGIPFYVQLLIAYYVVPYVLGLTISPFNAASLSLGLCSAAYVSQIVRGG